MTGQPKPGLKTEYCVVLDDKQITRFSANADFLYGASGTDENLTIMTFSTRETRYDVDVTLGGLTPRHLRKNAF